jgi:2-polyprenyl-3-methyl-5-hydroxy-6-metoxy-1,4-benzoquinol methylase
MKNYCEICGNNKLIEVLNLGRNPLCDDLIKISSKKKNLLHKIVILFCNNCLTGQQKYPVKKKILFPKSYHYRAALTKDVTNGLKNLVLETEKLIGGLKNKLVLDIGCNDGSLLNFFNEKCCKTVGIEPTSAAKDADKSKHIIFNNYFDLLTANKVKKKFKKIDIITFTNVFAHIENFQAIIKNLKKIITDKTLIVIENHYLGSVLDKMQFDTFYHEHARTYSFESFLHISKLLNLDIIKVSFPKRYGGNIRIFLRKKSGKNKISFSKIKKKENNFLKEFSNMRKNIKIWKVKKRKEILFYYKKYGKISAKSFPGRAAILIKTLGIDEKIISAVYEKSNSLKIGNCVPATKIPIISDELFFENKLEEKIIINFAWHISAEINNYMRMRGFKGKILDIIGKNDFA